MEKENSLIKISSSLISKIDKNFNLVEKILNTVDLQNWWQNLNEEWKIIFKKKIKLNTEPSLYDLQNLILTDSITCDHKKINSLEPLSLFKNLKRVSLMMCEHIQNLEPLINNKKILTLNLIDTKIQKIEVFKHLTSLEELLLSDHVTDLNPLSNLINLKVLNFQNCLSIQSLESLVLLENLEVLIVSDTIKDLKPIDNLKKIKTLVCFGVSKEEVLRFKKQHPETEIIAEEKTNRSLQ